MRTVVYNSKHSSQAMLQLRKQQHYAEVKSVVRENIHRSPSTLNQSVKVAVINTNAAITLLEQRPEKNFRLNFFSGLCSSSVTAAFALMTAITQLLLNGQLTFNQ